MIVAPINWTYAQQSLDSRLALVLLLATRLAVLNLIFLSALGHQTTANVTLSVGTTETAVTMLILHVHLFVSYHDYY